MILSLKIMVLRRPLVTSEVTSVVNKWPEKNFPSDLSINFKFDSNKVNRDRKKLSCYVSNKTTIVNAMHGVNVNCFQAK